MTTRLPRPLAAMKAGQVDAYKASKIADATEAERRAAARRHEWCVDLIHQSDGMATLTADLPADTAQAIHVRLDRAARQRRGPDEPRTLDQLRTDVLTELCLGTQHHDQSEITNSGPARAEIFLYLSAATLAGASDEPAELAGHGPLPAATARVIAHQPNVTWRRILTDPVSGDILDVGRTRYRPPAALDDHVRIRDRTCRHPGCHRPTHHGDLDHHTAWSHHAGPTSAANLLGFCRRHHQLKDEPGWSHHLDDGTLTITTPTGRAYTSTPEPPP